jgi:hypothetical protein
LAKAVRPDERRTGYNGRAMSARPIAIASLWLLVLAAPARAQGPRWEIEGYGGVGLPQALSGGTTTLPLPGPSLTTSSPIFPTHQVPSWFFGDGAKLLNDVNADFGVSARIVPLDAILGRDGISTEAVAAFGARLRRRLTSRASLEVSLDVLPRSEASSDDVARAIDTTVDSFGDAFVRLFRSGPFSDISTLTAKSVGPQFSRDIGATGALQYAWAPDARFTPYVTFGGGVVTRSGYSGGSPFAAITGAYRASILNQVPIQEFDQVELRLDYHSALTAVVGGGVRRTLSERWGLSFDARAWIGGNTTDLLIDATPSIVRGTPAGFIESLTTPSIQFSNDPSTGRTSTLSGDGLQGFKAYSGGVQTRLLVTVGVYRRF